jgi:hypothetical protein
MPSSNKIKNAKGSKASMKTSNPKDSNLADSQTPRSATSQDTIDTTDVQFNMSGKQPPLKIIPVVPFSRIPLDLR